MDELGRADRRRQRAAAAQGEAGSYHGTVSLDELIERGYHGGAEQDELAERYEAEDLRMRVRSAMTCLPPRQREVLERYYGQSLTLREAGLRMASATRACIWAARSRTCDGRSPSPSLFASPAARVRRG